MKCKKGISLIALVVTIIVLLILSGISIFLIFGDNSTFSKSKEGKIDARYSVIIDKVKMRETEITINKHKGIASSSAQEFVLSLISAGLINSYEDAWEDDYSYM